MIGNEVSILDALFVSIFSMTIVFLCLLSISYIIDLTAFIERKFTKE